MGNLICCYGKDDQKRGGVNVKRLLRKTEKPGKRRKGIDDLVADALKREKRDERQKKKKEKKECTFNKDTKGHVQLKYSKMKDNKIQGQTFDGDVSKENNSDDVEQRVYSNDLSAICKTVSETNRSVRYQRASVSALLSLKTDSFVEVSEYQNNSDDGFQEYYKCAIINGTGCSVREFGLEDHDKSGTRLNTFQNDAVDFLQRHADCDSNEVNGNEREEEPKSVLKDVETSQIDDYVNRENGQDDQLAKPLETVENYKNSCKDNDDYLNTEPVIGEENSITEDEAGGTEDSTRDFRNEQSVMTETENDDTRNSGGLPLVSSMDHGVENMCENDGGNLHTVHVLTRIDLHNEICDSVDASSVIPEEDTNDRIADSTRDNCGENPAYDINKSTDDDNKAVNIFIVQDDTDKTLRGDENTDLMDDGRHVNKELGKDCCLGYDDTKLPHEKEDDEECFKDNLALKPIQRSKSMPLRRWGSANDLRTTMRTPTDSSKDIKSFRNQLNRLKQIYALSKTRGIVMKNHLQRTSIKRSTLKYRIMNLAVNGGQKPQIKEILRLKKDPFNFPPKIRHLTERDRQGSIADLKWSRHMRAEVRRHITMESAEFEELLLLNGEEYTDDSEFDVYGESRAPTPVPGYDEPRAPTPVPGYDEPGAPTQVPGCDFQHAPSPTQDSSRAPSPNSRCEPRRTKTQRKDVTMRNLRERYGTDRVPYIRHNTPNTSRFTMCSRHSKPNPTNYRLNTLTGDRKTAAFQTIKRQFEKSFKDAEARRSKETKEHNGNQTSCVGIGRQNSFMNLADDVNGRDN